MRCTTKNSIVMRWIVVVMILCATFGVLVVDAGFSIMPSNNLIPSTYYFAINDAAHYMNYFYLTSNQSNAWQQFVPAQNTDFPFQLLSVNPFTAPATSWSTAQIKNTSPKIDIRNNNGNILILNILIYTSWYPSVTAIPPLMIRNTNGMKLYRDVVDTSAFILIQPTLTQTIIPCTDRSNNTELYSNMLFITLRYDLPRQYLYPIDGSQPYCYLGDVDLFQFYNDKSAGVGLYNFGTQQYLSLFSSENFNDMQYQTQMIVNALQSGGTIDAAAIVAAVNENGNKIVTATNDVTRQIFEYDIGDLPEEIIAQIAAEDHDLQSKYDEFENMFNNYFDEFKDTFDQIFPGLGRSRAASFHSSIASPIYSTVTATFVDGVPLVTFLLIGSILFTVTIFILRR